jgi:hypothetical protein
MSVFTVFLQKEISLLFVNQRYFVKNGIMRKKMKKRELLASQSHVIDLISYQMLR